MKTRNNHKAWQWEAVKVF